MNAGAVVGVTGLALAVVLLGWAIGGPRPAPIIAPVAFVLPIAPALCLTMTSGAQQVVGASGLALAFSALVAVVLRLDREEGQDEVHSRWQEFERAFRRHVDGSADRPSG